MSMGIPCTKSALMKVVLPTTKFILYASLHQAGIEGLVEGHVDWLASNQIAHAKVK